MSTFWWIVIGLALAWLLAVAALLIAGRRMAARQLVRAVPDLARLLKGLLRDRRVPLGSKLLVGAAALWLISPIDLVPEFLPVVGAIDDVIVVVLVLRHLLKTAGPEVIEAHWTGDPELLRRALRFAGWRSTSARYPSGA